MNGNDTLAEMTTVEDAASAILRHSFAVFQVDDHLREKIRTAHRSAKTFFHHVQTVEQYDCAAETDNKDGRVPQKRRHFPYQHIVNGNLYGYNVPSPAKQLFRAYCHSNLQPWPDDDDDGETFRNHSRALVEGLHMLLVDCCHHIVREHSRKTSPLPSPTPLSPFRPAKRQRNTITSTRLDLELPKHAKDSDISPLDSFFYHNRHPSLVNCSEHVDRGVLIVVCLTDVPGLEVWDRQTSSPRFVCPEVLVETVDPGQEAPDESCCSTNLVCIMAGGQLAPLLAERFSPREAVKNEHENEERGMEVDDAANKVSLPRACLHRVRRHLERARLSITYELRV